MPIFTESCNIILILIFNNCIYYILSYWPILNNIRPSDFVSRSIQILRPENNGIRCFRIALPFGVYCCFLINFSAKCKANSIC